MNLVPPKLKPGINVEASSPNDFPKVPSPSVSASHFKELIAKEKPGSVLGHRVEVKLI